MSTSQAAGERIAQERGRPRGASSMTPTLET
jgi:hypothetical protein